ncbi:hypothetical protein MK280_16945 [Myxococcota bacterium]|nr:hypothetical protein [Myxococcota bacterium]
MKAVLLDIGTVLMGFDFSRARHRLRSKTVGHPDPIRALRPLKGRPEIGAIDRSTFMSEGMELLHFQGHAQAFHGGIYSHEVSALKPDAAIFEAATHEFPRFKQNAFRR